MARWDEAWHKRLRQILADLAFRPQHERIAIRRALATDPVAFSVIYLSHHLKDHAGRVTFSEVHYEWCRIADREWRQPLAPQENRHAFIAPRETGKSTWWFLVLPMWAACNRLARFIVAFANADGQATGHLATFKRELDTNALLQADFPELCEPARKVSGSTLADRQGMLHTRDGFVFAAKGVDTATLGLKVGEIRPDLLIFDDIEPHEEKYSVDLARKRLSTITSALFPLNIRARVVMVGTVTMPDSIMHGLVKVANGADSSVPENELLRWIGDEKVVPHHHRPIVLNDDGTERSIWPEKWPLSWLFSYRHTRSYAKNYDNDPMGIEGLYWTMDDFEYGPFPGPPATRFLLQLDPAVTTKDKSDWTGWAIVAHRPGAPPNREKGEPGRRPVCEVVAAGRVKLSGEALRSWVLTKLAQHPRVKAVRVEVNQGGDLWYTVLHDLPVKLLVHNSTESKEVRFSYVLDFYHRGLVRHREFLRELQEQMVSFPRAPYDDIADAAVCGILYFMDPIPASEPTALSHSYV